MLGRRDNLVPFVYVIQPSLEPDGDGNVPHVYNDGSLCLNRKTDLAPSDLYAHTIVPWASEWLFYYEIWKATAIWMGDLTNADIDSTRAVLHPYLSAQDSNRPEVNTRPLINARSERGEKR
jgi:hypothetical protein